MSCRITVSLVWWFWGVLPLLSLGWATWLALTNRMLVNVTQAESRMLACSVNQSSFLAIRTLSYQVEWGLFCLLGNETHGPVIIMPEPRGSWPPGPWVGYPELASVPPKSQLITDPWASVVRIRQPSPDHWNYSADPWVNVWFLFQATKFWDQFLNSKKTTRHTWKLHI